MESSEDCLNILGLSAGATWDEINEAYRDLIRVWHPDRFQSDERLRKKAEDHSCLLNQAVKQLRESYKPAVAAKTVKTTAKPKSKQRFYSDLESHAADPREQRSGFHFAPLLVYQRPFSASLRVIGSVVMAYLGYFGVTHAQGDPFKTACASALTLFALNSIVKNLCHLFVRRPLIRVDSYGISSIDTGSLSWPDLAKVWTFVQASSPALAIECSELYLRGQPFLKRLRLRFCHAFRSAHIVVTCNGMDAHPNDIVRAINALHLTGDVQQQQLETRLEMPNLGWCRLIATLSAAVLIGRCLIGTEMIPFDFALYFTVFVLCQGYHVAARLLSIPQQA